MGTDLQGRDELSRLIYGARVSLIAGVASVSMGVLIGGTIGAFAGGLGGRVDSVLMRVVDVMLSIPGILLAIGIVAWLDRGLPQIIFAVAMVNVPIFARILRGSLLSLRESDYVLASRSLGAGRTRILLRHMIPNSPDPVDRRRDPRARDRDHRRRGARLPGPRAARTRGSRSGARCSPTRPSSCARRRG